VVDLNGEGMRLIAPHEDEWKTEKWHRMMVKATHNPTITNNHETMR